MSQASSSGKETPLQSDLRQLMNDERFYDIDLECSDKKIISGCKGILATRSEIFNKLIFTGLEKNNLSFLSFNNINSNSMKVILEYLYVSKVKEKNLTVSNIIEVYHASIYFGLTEFQSLIINQVMEFSKSGNVNTGKKLLSECVKKFSLEVDNEMSRILVDWVAMNKLKKGVNDSLSFEGLKYFLIKTFDTKKPFATPEIEIWEYILARAKKDQQGVQQYLSKLADYINLNRIDAEEIKNRIELFNIYSDKKLKEVYFSMAVGKGLELIRGVPIFKWKIGRSGLKVFDGGFTVEADEGVRPKSILGDLIFQGRGVYEWNILIDKMYNHIYIGICDIHENLNNNFFLTDFSFNYRHGWVLGSDGYVYHKTQHKWYDAKFKEGDKVTVRLDMKERTCAFSVNDIRKPIVSEWKNIPSQVYPVVSLGHGSKLRVKQELI